MSTGVPQVNSSATVLEACKIMNREGFSGVLVKQRSGTIGIFTDRALLHRFVSLNKRPDEVKVGDVMGPLLKVDAKASTKQAARKMMTSKVSRLGVFDGDKCLGWVSLTDLARETSKKNLVDALFSHESGSGEVLCPKCRKALLKKITGKEGNILRWECSHCKYVT